MSTKRPRLSLQTNPSPSPPRARSYSVNPSDPTAFNTLSNVYATAIGRASTPTEPATAINTFKSFALSPTDARPRVVTPFVACYPESPVSAATSPLSQQQHPFQSFPSAMTPTPPLSAGPADGKVFVFPGPKPDLSVTMMYGAQLQRQTVQSTQSQSKPVHVQPAQSQSQPQPPKLSIQAQKCISPIEQRKFFPYAHPNTLHSILRNSPLPPRTALSPRRQSQRLAEKALLRVGYESPLEQEIITNKYTKSHIDLLLEDASPLSPLDVARAAAFTANELQDGGQTPGPMEDMERRLSKFSTALSPLSAGVKKRSKRKEKKRQWVWTLGREEEEGDDEEVGGAIAALREAKKKTPEVEMQVQVEQAKKPELHVQVEEIMQPEVMVTCEQTPTPSVERDADGDAAMSDAESVATTGSLSVLDDLKTPVGPVKKRDTPIPELAEA